LKPSTDRLIVVLGVNHRLQGIPNREGNVEDPAYSALLKRLIAQFSLDYLFEEATELGPSTAQVLAAKYAKLTYLDIDPHPRNRAKFGLQKDTGHPSDIFWQPWDSHLPVCGEVCEEYLDAQIPREHHWVSAINKTRFTNAVVVCGFLHTLSLAERLKSSGITTVKALAYMPYQKLAMSYL
jgi:hypothetical protein